SGHGLLAPVVQTQGDVRPCKPIEHAVDEPRLVPDLERPADVGASGEHPQQPLEPIETHVKARRQLDQHRPERTVEPTCAPKKERQGRAGRLQTLDVRQIAAGLDREDEAGWNGGGPRAEGGGGRQAIKGTVQLDGVERRRVVRQPRARAQPPRLKPPPPGAIAVAARSDAPMRHCKTWIAFSGPARASPGALIMAQPWRTPFRRPTSTSGDAPPFSTASWPTSRSGSAHRSCCCTAIRR